MVYLMKQFLKFFLKTNFNLNFTTQELESPNKIVINVDKTTNVPYRHQLLDFVGTRIPKLANKSHYENLDIFKHYTFFCCILYLIL